MLRARTKVRVEESAALTLESITVANAVRSTAIAIEAGSARLTNCTVRNCSATMNSVNADWLIESRGGAISVNAADRLELVFVDLYGNVAADGEAASSGGAIFCRGGGSSVSVSRSKLRENVARRAGLASRAFVGIAQGGAICVTDESFLVVADSELLANVAKDGGWISQGGAIYGIHGAVLTIRSSKLCQNLVDTGGLLFTASELVDAGSYGGAIFVEVDSHAEVIDSEVCDNNVRGGAEWTEAGGIGAYDGSSLVVVRSKLLRNSVLGCNSVQGGAMYLIGADKPGFGVFNQSEISDNHAVATAGAADSEAGTFSQGGAVYVQKAQLAVVDCNVYRNVVRGGNQAFGGAFYFDGGSNVHMLRSAVSSNVATGGALFSRGGGIFSDVLGSGKLLIESTELGKNSAAGSGAPAAGGALYCQSGNTALIGSNLTANFAAGRTAYGGAVYAGSTLLMHGVTVSKNRVVSRGVNGEAFGGGVFNHAPTIRIADSHLFENVASIESPAIQVSAGAVYNAFGARAILDGCVLWSNAAGGAGRLQDTAYAYDDDARANYEALKASHIFSDGRIDLTRIVIHDDSHFESMAYRMLGN